MRTTAPMLVVLCIGVSGFMLHASGFTNAWGAPAPSTDAAQGEVENANQSSGPEGGPVSGPVNSGDSSIIGLIADSLSTLTTMAGAAIQLPKTLINLGFPAWLANPIGRLAQAISGIGIIQFATNRVWK
jgi:hypothetical protein